jgi:hypothetical protein
MSYTCYIINHLIALYNYFRGSPHSLDHTSPINACEYFSEDCQHNMPSVIYRFVVNTRKCLLGFKQLGCCLCMREMRNKL